MRAEYSYCRDYLIKNGKPWFPVMGEMHYSRYRKEWWEESLRKIKAGGVSVVSAYVIWIHHEEEENVFDFEGCRDIGTFVRLCRKVGLSVFLRIGPFVHGEVRNGGFPDWIIEREKEGMAIRCNNEEYLGYVRRFWKKVYAQVDGCMEKDGGPVIGIQIENEYGHVGGLQGPEGEAHIRTLTAMAKEIGFDVPLYTATGWGGACIGDLLPVMGGYCEAPWDQRTCEIEPNANFVFSHTRNDALIACDHHVENANSYNEEDFPFLTAELGGGLQVTMHRRPVAKGCDVGAMSTVKMGSGAGLLGYYMYHGGINKIGRHSTLNESRASGYPNDCPILSYFEHTAISPYGETGDTYRLLNLLHLFVRDFGSLLAPLPYVPSPEKPTPDNTAALRYAMRSDGTRGFVFVNQYQRLRCMQRVEDVRFDTGTVCFPPLTVPGGASFILPFGLELCGETLTYATAQPICRDGNTIFFAALDGIEPCYCFGSTAYRPAALPDTHRFGDLCVVTLPFAQALYLRKLNGQVVLGDGCDVYTADNQIHAVQPGNFAYSVWNGTQFVQHSVQKHFSPAVLQAEPLDLSLIHI